MCSSNQESVCCYCSSKHRHMNKEVHTSGVVSHYQFYLRYEAIQGYSTHCICLHQILPLRLLPRTAPKDALRTQATSGWGKWSTPGASLAVGLTLTNHRRSRKPFHNRKCRQHNTKTTSSSFSCCARIILAGNFLKKRPNLAGAVENSSSTS